MIRVLNKIYYVWKRNNWMVDFSRYFSDFKEIKIEKPIFLLGVQGGGLTLISRMLRRNKKVVSVTGNYKYWYGADEMQNVLWPILPVQFAGIKGRYPDGGDFLTSRGWLYATDRLIGDYRLTEKDVTEELRKKFRKIIRWLIARHQGGKRARFIDKSQVFTVKVSFINEILKDKDPKFILITRNPYALCYRSVVKKGEAPELKKAVKKFGFEKTLHLAAEHWKNSMKYALEDKEKVENFLLLRLEDFLKEPEKKLKEVCQLVELRFSKSMLPSKNNGPGVGTRSFPDKKWYPLKREVNKKYLAQISEREINIVKKVCGRVAEKVGYKKP